MMMVQFIFLTFLLISTIKPSIHERTTDNSEIFKNHEKLKNYFQSIVDEIIQAHSTIPKAVDRNLVFNSNGILALSNLTEPNNRIRRKLLALSEKINNLTSQSITIQCIDNSIENKVADLIHKMASIYYLYDESVRLQTQDSAQTRIDIRAYCYSVSTMDPSLLEVLTGIYNILMVKSSKTPEFNQKFLKLKGKSQGESNDNNICDNFSPTQQSLFCVYVAIMTTEIDGFIAYAHDTALRMLMGIKISTDDLVKARDGALARLSNYTIATRNLMNQLSTVVRRCDPNKWIRDQSFFEMNKHRQIRYVYEFLFNKSCGGRCNTVDYSSYQPDGDGEVIRCFNIESPVDICDAPPNSPRTIEWILANQGNQYGRMSENCDRQRNFEFHGMTPENNCGSCMCEVVRPHKISIGEQLSTISQNKIIVGIKFVKKHDIIGLQIQERKLNKMGAVDFQLDWNDVQDLDSVVTFDANKITRIHLDDVIVPSGYVVTGVKLAVTEDGKGIKLVVRGTKYDFFTGNLMTTSTEWFDPESEPQDRIKAGPLFDDDDPSLNTTNTPVGGLKPSYVEFSTTSFQSDAGQMTIPLFDSQIVTTHPAFPLHGIGIFYKKTKGYGGFIALQIFTDNLGEYLE